MISGKSRQPFSEWWRSGKQRISELLFLNKQYDQKDCIGLVINPQYVKVLKINRDYDQYEIEHFNVVALPEGLVVNNEIKDCAALSAILKDMFEHANLSTKNIACSIPRSSAIVKTITVNAHMQPDEIESRVWLEAGKLFPNLIGDIYLDFAVNGPSPQDPAQIEILVVACRKDQLKPYLDVMRMSGLNARVVDINYYAYERALSLIIGQSPQIKTIALLNISFNLIDILVVSEGNLIYTHELSYDGCNLLNIMKNTNKSQGSSNTTETTSVPITQEKSNEVLKNTIGLHLKHALQFFYSSRPNIRVERIVLSGDAAAGVPSMLDYVRQEIGKDVVMADPFKDMKLSANIDHDKLIYHAPAFMLCCGLAITKLV